MNERIPTTEKLAQALEQAGAPLAMISAARRGRYDDYKCEESATPCIDLVNDLRLAGLDDLIKKAMNGEFDAQKWESDEWAKQNENDPELGPIIKSLGLGAK